MSSGWISLDLKPGIVPVTPGGVKDHHITVVYLGPDVDDDLWERACTAVRNASVYTPPLTGVIGGIGEFPAGEHGVPVFAHVSMRGLKPLHSVLKHLEHETSAAAVHGYTPHVTLAYAQDDTRPEPLPDTPVKFDKITVHLGDWSIQFPLTGDIRC